MSESITTSVYDAALQYISDGRAVIPLHWIEDNGHCSCERLSAERVAATGRGEVRTCDPRTAGKHPMRSDWASGDRLSTADAYAIWQEQYPRANIGIRTGVISGIYVLDVDPDAGGRESLRELQEMHGQLPETLVTSTGSGGDHYWYAMPDGVEVRNSQGKLGPGLDIRGDGGQIVAPPSVSGKGAYGIRHQRAIGQPPAWQVEGFREAATARTKIADTATVHIEDLEVAADLDADTAERVQHYAETVIGREAERYVGAPPGDGDFTLYTALCNAIEIAQSPWNTVTYEHVIATFDKARLDRRMRHPDSNGGQSEDDFRRCFRSARSTTVGKGRPLPADISAGVTFSPGDAGTAMMSGTGTAAPAAATEAKPVDRRAEIRARLLASTFGRAELADLPPPVPLIKGVLDRDSESWLIGAPGSFKGFVVMDWAAHVAMGRPWRGHQVTRSKVYYLAAEGFKGIPKRIAAWEATYGTTIDSEWFRLQRQAVQVRDGESRFTGRPGVEWQVLCELVAEERPGLVVIDTQARVTVGMKENDNGEMGILTAAVAMMREATGACVLVVHHTGRNGGDARGASAIDGAQDAELKVERPESRAGRASLTARIRIDKMKDGDESTDWPIQLTPVEVGADDDGLPITSLAVAPKPPFASAEPATPEPAEEDLTDRQGTILETMRLTEAHRERGATQSDVRGWIADRVKAGKLAADIPKSGVDKALQALVTKGKLVRAGARYVLAEWLEEVE